MSLEVDIYDSDFGIIIRLNCKTDCSGALTRAMMIKKMDDGTIVEVTAEQDADNNYIRYVVPESDSPFSVFGRYMVRSKVKFSESQEQQGDPVEMVVGKSWTVLT